MCLYTLKINVVQGFRVEEKLVVDTDSKVNELCILKINVVQTLGCHVSICVSIRYLDLKSGSKQAQISCFKSLPSG